MMMISEFDTMYMYIIYVCVYLTLIMDICNFIHRFIPYVWTWNGQRHESDADSQ